VGKLALYRAYRPLDFSDVVGQDHVTDTLEKAFARGLMSHAYLLTGPRGVGKTSVARIIARRVNQLPAEAELARELDILEIDAASNRGIDDIRALRDKLATVPSRLPYKVFIIDEAHMLTREAFNALLKTLEEPPAHVIFVLATTEVHKLPDTIVSRTQRHDFRLITTEALTKALAGVAQTEKISIDDEALALIAERSQGGFRDALSLLDQLASRGEAITGAMVASTAGIGALSQALEIARHSLQGDAQPALGALQESIQIGAEPSILTEFLLAQIRASFLKPGSVAALQDIPAVDLVRGLTELSRALAEQRYTPIPSLPLELAIWRLATPAEAAAIPVPSATKQSRPVSQSVPSVSAAPAIKAKAQPVRNQPGVTDSVVTTKALSFIKTKNNSLYAILRSGSPSLDGEILTITCNFRFHQERIEEARNRQLIESIFSRVAGRTVEMRVEHSAATGQSNLANDSGEELVASALEILGGEVIE